MNFKRMKLIKCVFTVSILLCSSSVLAIDNDNDNAFNFWSNQGWTQIRDDDGLSNSSGGQAFDTEYLFFKYDLGATNSFADDTISIGLQTGFDVSDNHILYGSKNYYGGDLALSFDGVVNNSSNSTSPGSNGYEYAVDFGKETRTKYGRTHRYVNSDTSDGFVDITDNGDYKGNDSSSALGAGIDAAGLYDVDLWSTRISNTNASPFAMDGGNILQGLSFSESNTDNSSVAANGFGQIGDSFYRTVTFNANKVLTSSAAFTVDAHWTMSCGNDEINGRFDYAGYTPPGGGTPVSEPSILALFSLGSLSLGFMGYRRRKMTEEGAFIA